MKQQKTRSSCKKSAPFATTQPKRADEDGGVQHYQCLTCGKQWQNQRRPKKLAEKIWQEHIWQRQTVANLRERYHRGKNWIRKTLDEAEIRESAEAAPQPVVGIFDATKLGLDLLLVARAPELGINLGWSWIESETKDNYARLKRGIETRGFTFTAAVLDGRRGIPRVFEGIPIQICQFHQLQIVRRKLTLRPETLAGQELLSPTFTLAKTDEATFTRELESWYAHYEQFLKEKTFTLGTKRWRYTHARVRSAYLSLKRNLPFLFTYQKYPELNIPNTTNSLDGFWSRLKNLLAAHRGKSRERVRKIVKEILRKQTA